MFAGCGGRFEECGWCIIGKKKKNKRFQTSGSAAVCREGRYRLTAMCVGGGGGYFPYKMQQGQIFL